LAAPANEFGANLRKLPVRLYYQDEARFGWIILSKNVGAQKDGLMSFPEQTKATKKSKRKAPVFEGGSIPSRFRAFGWDGFWPGKIISSSLT
jgi:hypothetical protein